MAQESSSSTDKYDFAPLTVLKKRIEEELSEMDANFQLVLQQQIKEAERLKKEKEEADRLAKAEAEKKQREEEERIAKEEAESKIKAEANRVEQERLRKIEEERKRKLAEAEAERKRQAEEAEAERQRLENETKARDEAEKLRQITALKAQYSAKLEELLTLQVLEEQVKDILNDMKELSQLDKSEDNIENLNAKITLVNKIIDFINQNKPKTVADIKSTEDYNKILRNIIFIMESYNNKSDGQKELIDQLPEEYSDKFKKIQELYKAALSDKNMKILIEHNSDENKQIFTIEYDAIILYIQTVINTPDILSLLENHFSDLNEIIVGTARVANRFKPNDGDNTAPIILKTDKDTYNAKTYLNSLLPIQSAGGVCGGNTNTNIIQKGGYDYEDVIKVVNDGGKNYLEIGDICKTPGAGAGEVQKPYGPFYGIYPPQFNNFHIYYNMFGILKYGEQIDTTDTALTNSYDTLLKQAKFNSVSTRSFSMEHIENQPHNLMKKLNNGDSAVIFGYGFSGSGKTYALIEGSVTEINSKPDSIKYDPSILEQFIKDNADNINSVEFLELYPLGISHNPHKALLPITDDNIKKIDKATISENVTKEQIKKYASQYGIEPFESIYGTEYSTIENLYTDITGNITYDKISTRIKLLERHRISKLRILATPNNDKSSRSFLQITLNLKPIAGFETKKPKLVFFDMPGTENTVRIKTEFLDKKIFTFDKNINALTQEQINELIKSGATNNKNVMINDPLNTKYVFSNFGSNTLYNIEFYNSDPLLTNGIRINYFKKLNNIDKPPIKACFDEIKKIFKYFYMQKYNFDKIKVNILGGDDVVAFDSLEFALFINGYDVKREQTFEATYNNIPENTVIYFLNNDKFIKIYENFKLFLNKTDNKTPPQNIYVIENADKNNPYCKIDYLIDSIDEKNLLNIFNITLKSPKISEIFLDKKFLEKKKYYANPLIKYIDLILEYIEYNSKNRSKTEKYDDIMANMEEQVKIRASVFFIYKYINFIVNQGRSIVTNLEHLKFFFLTRTGIINTYNSEALEEAGTSDKNKSFYSSDAECKSIKDKPKEYTKPTSIGTITTIHERVNVGNMTQYGLIDILQQLSESPLLASCECKEIELGKKYNVNLLKAKDATTLNSLLGAIFIMFTNYKIFLNDKTISELKKDNKTLVDKLSTLCTAAKDTAEFTESISSTSTSKARIVKAKPISTTQQTFSTISTKFKDLFPNSVVAQGGKRKFNINQLLNNNNQHNQKHKTHKIKRFSSMKNILKNNKLFSTKTKKNKV